MVIYFPMSLNILTKGHIKCLRALQKSGQVIVGLLTSEAMRGYKEELMPYNERKYILKALALKEAVRVVPQNSLDPYLNLKKYKCDAMASGDGFEKVEFEAANKLGVKLIKINSGEKLHSSDLLKRTQH